MNTLGITFIAVGFALFAACVVYYMIDEKRTEVRSRARGRVVALVTIAAWLLFLLGIVLSEAPEEGLGQHFADPFGWVTVLLGVGGSVNFWLWARRRENKKKMSE
jgi:cytochrome bd-type quinol oxidase subunit 2